MYTELSARISVEHICVPLKGKYTGFEFGILVVVHNLWMLFVYVDFLLLL